MTARANARRERAARVLGAVAVFLAALALAALLRDASARRDAVPVTGPVLADWSPETAQRAARITVTTKDEPFTVSRIDGVWRLEDKAGYPADPAVVEALGAGLGALTYVATRTRDPQKHARLGLDAPEEGGDGVRLHIEEESGGVLAALVLGEAREGGGLFLRREGDPQTFAVAGDLPRIATPRDWMDLAFLDLERDEIVAASVTPPRGPAYVLRRPDAAARDFALEEPTEGWRLLTEGAGNATATATSLLRFEDVVPDSALEGVQERARHVVETADGTRITLTMVDADPMEGGQENPDEAAEPDQWITLTAEPTTDPRAATIAEIAAGWAYAPPAFASERIFRTLEAIGEQVDEDASALDAPEAQP